MTIKKYIRLPNAPFTEADTQAIGETLTRLAAKGQSSSVHILAEARKASSPLHPYIEWDDAKAAEAHREHQATRIANKVAVRVVTAEGEERVLRAFHAVTVSVAGAPSRFKHYVPLEVVRESADYSGQVVEEAWRQLRSWRDRWDLYRVEFGAVFGAIDELIDEATQEVVA